ncbi:tryptophanase (plasmid) [Kovacikia minuta CCNUW1]|uniref:tryptophanase n=1 Tax=Kovacikia minuta TaxID=2931930 RepID=UPI001CCABFE3|nr:tryptophanase [Kovacikia minuta]UBF29971.1 tryptophanase [Kovacikia minuta CCNUW1]
MKTMIEPFRIKMVEPIRFTVRSERETLLQTAGLNLFRLRAEDVTIDLLTDSGTGAMSSDAWAALVQGDESYAGAKSWYRFEAAVQKIFGFPHVIPTHQGRAAERLFASLLIRPGMVIPNNTHFDTTRANIEVAGGKAIDLPCPEASDLALEAPFKGDMDVAALELLIANVGAHHIPAILLTITNNSGGGQPVSMANIRAVSKLAHFHGIPLYIDACRFAENAYFIQQREAGYQQMPVAEIVQELFAYADGCLMSAKKDAFANIGGFLCTRDAQLAEEWRRLLILTEGFPTYGGLAGRDLEAIAVGLHEVLDENYLRYRIASTGYVAERLHQLGIPAVRPAGGHAVYIDARRFLPHIQPLQYPGQALAVELYLEAGIRTVEVGTVMFGRDAHTGTEQPAKWDLLRLSMPRRVYTQSHMDYVIEAIALVWQRREQIRGLKIVNQPPYLRHFSAQFEWI